MAGAKLTRSARTVPAATTLPRSARTVPPAAWLTRPTRTAPAPAPGLGGGKEGLVFVLGGVSIYLLYLAVRPYLRRLRRAARSYGRRLRRRYLRLKKRWTSYWAERNKYDSRTDASYSGPGRR